MLFCNYSGRKVYEKPLSKPYDDLFARFARKKWDEGCFGFGQSPKPKHFSPPFASEASKSGFYCFIYPTLQLV
jgi:hypothetical protein